MRAISLQEGWRIMDFLSHHPESCHMVGTASSGQLGGIQPVAMLSVHNA
jgi:hypothetical protein